MELPVLPQLSKWLKDNWMFGKKFIQPPTEPFIVMIDKGEEDKPIVPFFKNPQIASNEFIDALFEIGADNMDLYDVILQSEDEKKTD